MLQQTRTERLETHEVFNQPPPLAGYNLYLEDPTLQSALKREGGDWGESRLEEFGQKLGGEPLELAELANKNQNLPELVTHDRYGNRIDEIRFHPAWHALLKLGVENEIPSLPWNEDRPGAHVVRAGLFILLSQVEAGIMCPISMTYAAIPAIANSVEVEAEWREKLTMPDYENGALAGMALTEKQGGSDVGANTTEAQPAEDDWYELTGHKWFCSYPVADAFLVTARTPDSAPGTRGLSCFMLPRFLPDGTLNNMFILKLKDKLGTRSLPSAEVEYAGARAKLIGEEGAGMSIILEMVNHTRLDCILGSAAGMRRAVAEAMHHAAYREAFGKLLIDQPLMQNVLGDLCVESEAATVAALRLARSYGDEDQVPFKRLATAVLKFQICKQAPTVAAEALECLGGNGFVEDSVMPLIYRDSQVNSTWEGSGNVIALDVLRAMVKEEGSLDAYTAELELAEGTNPHLDEAIGDLKATFGALADQDAQYGARSLVEKMATTLQGALLVLSAQEDPELQATADAFCMSRLGAHGRSFGTLPAEVDCVSIIDRYRPKI